MRETGVVKEKGGKERGMYGCVFVAEENFGFDALGEDPGGEEDVVECEGSDPCTGDGCGSLDIGSYS